MQLNVREKVIQSACKLFYEDGFNKTGINAVISEAGVAKASLYGHFASKDKLAVIYLQQMASNFKEDLDLYLEPLSDKKRVLGLFDHLLHYSDTPKFNGDWSHKIINEVGDSSPAISAEVRLQKASQQEYIQKILASSNLLKAKKVDKVAKRIFLLYEMAISESYVLKATWPIKEAKEMVKDLLS